MAIQKSGTFGILGRSYRDAGHHGTNLGHPGWSGTGGNPTEGTKTEAPKAQSIKATGSGVL